MERIQLIVGLGNPGQQYANTRHNAGAWFIEELLKQSDTELNLESKLKASLTSTKHFGEQLRLAIPTTYMNESGLAVAAIAHFYKIPPEAILIAHDEIDFEVATTRLKKGGGHGGHNGLRDIIKHLNSADFWRLRIGVGHPGHKDRVHDYVLNRPTATEQQSIAQDLEKAVTIIPLLLQAKFEQAMTALHSEG